MPPSGKFIPIRSLSKSREVFEQLRQAIWSGRLEPGAPLREAHIARQLNVSQVPVREALLQLENLGLVLRIPDRGTTVTRMTRTEILQMVEVRRHLELMAFQLAARRLTPETVAELRLHIRNLQQHVAAGDHFTVAEEDFAFHRAVWRASGNEVLERTLERLCVAFYAFISLKRHAAGETMKNIVRSHKHLLEVLMEKEPRAIATAIEEHIAPTDIPPTVPE